MVAPSQSKSGPTSVLAHLACSRASALAAARHAFRNHPFLITKDPGDVFFIDEIRAFYAPRPAEARFVLTVRDPRAGYTQTLDVLAYAKRHRPDVLTKSSLMLGLGERDDEVHQSLEDLRAHNVDIVTLGQYLRPTVNHLPVDRYVPPAEFDAYRAYGLELGFLEVAAGPLVRSSYRAERVLERNNLGLGTIPVRSL